MAPPSDLLTAFFSFHLNRSSLSNAVRRFESSMTCVIRTFRGPRMQAPAKIAQKDEFPPAHDEGGFLGRLELRKWGKGIRDVVNM